MQQLSQLKKQLDEELEHLTTSFQKLRAAQQKFLDCIKTIQTGVDPSATTKTSPAPTNTITTKDSTGAGKGKSILVPLTTSLYVPGTLADTENVIVDVGTGFYVEKKTRDAVVFYEGKVEELGRNLRDLEKIVQGKSQNLRMVEEGELPIILFCSLGLVAERHVGVGVDSPSLPAARSKMLCETGRDFC